jgi:hypothetical protein
LEQRASIGERQLLPIFRRSLAPVWSQAGGRMEIPCQW